MQRVGAPSPKPPSRDGWSGARGDQSSTLCVRGTCALEVQRFLFAKAGSATPHHLVLPLGSKDSFEARLESWTWCYQDETSKFHWAGA